MFLIKGLCLFAPLVLGPGASTAVASPRSFLDDGHQAIKAFDRRAIIKRFSPDGSKLLTIGFPEDAHSPKPPIAAVWDTDSWQRLRTGHLSDPYITPLDIESDGSIVRRDDSYIRRNWGHKKEFRNHAATKFAIPDFGRAVEVYDGPVCVATLKGHAGHYVLSHEFNHDETKAVTGGSDKKAIVWDLSNSRPLRIFVHDCSVVSAAFTPDERHVVTGCHDGTMHIWRLAHSQEEIHSLTERLSQKASAIGESAKSLESAEERFKLGWGLITHSNPHPLR